MSSCWLELKRYYTNSRFQQLDDSKLRSCICTSCPRNLSNRNKSPQKKIQNSNQYCFLALTPNGRRVLKRISNAVSWNANHTHEGDCTFPSHARLIKNARGWEREKTENKKLTLKAETRCWMATKNHNQAPGRNMPSKFFSSKLTRGQRVSREPTSKRLHSNWSLSASQTPGWLRQGNLCDGSRNFNPANKIH